MIQRISYWGIVLAVFVAFAASTLSPAAVFPATSTAVDNARLEITDITGGLSWNPSGTSPAPNGLTIMAWVKISIPTGTELTSNMTILANRRTLDWNQPHAWRIYFNVDTGNIEFSARGTSTLPPIKLVERPYLDRWYHLAVVRSHDVYTAYIDGRAQLPVGGNVGNTATTDGVSIGGFKGGEKFWGEIQEVAIIQGAQNATAINTNRLRDISPSYGGLKGYYKLAYSTNATDNLKNFAAAPPTGTETAVKVGTGTIEYPESDKQGEQSLFDSQKNNGRDALAPLAGSFSWQRTVLSRPTTGIPFELRVGYNSGISFNSQALEEGYNMFEEDSVMGPGWRHSFQTRLIPGNRFLTAGNGFIGLLLWDGSLETWQRLPGGIYRPLHGEYRGELIVDPASVDYLLWITPDRLIHRFHHPTETNDPFLAGKLKEIRDFNGNRLQLAYDPDSGRLDTVADTAGTIWKFTYNANFLKSVAALGWTVSFNYDEQNRLASFLHRGPSTHEATPLLNTTWVFNYSQPAVNGPPAIDRVTTPLGITDISVNYDKYGRKISETDGGSRSTYYHYHTPGPREITRTDGDQFKWIDTFDRKGHIISKQDPLGNISRFEYYGLTNGQPENNLVGGTPSSTGALKRQIEPLGWITTFDTYDERANLLQKTDALGHVWKWTFAKASDPAGANGKLSDGGSPAATSLLNRPLSDTRPRVDGETADWQNRYIHDSKGNLLRHEDDLGTLAEYEYDSRGLVTISRDGNYSGSHLSQSKTAYDPTTGFRISSTDPYSRTTSYQNTELGWVTATTDAIGRTTTAWHDINGNVTRTTDATARTITTEWDELGRQRFLSDAKGKKSEFAYDGSSLPQWTKDRAGNMAYVTHNNRSLVIRNESPAVPVSQPTGGPQNHALVTQRFYDDAGRLLREIDSTGVDYTEYSYDANGNTTTIRDRMGRIHQKQYDALSRAVVEIDPAGNVSSTTYDQAGRVSTVTSPNGSVSRHEYDGRGRLTRWTDPEGGVWVYRYDGVGNILEIEDAMHGIYRMTYDLRNARLTEKNQDGLDWAYTYDELGRLKTSTEPTGLTRTVHYDPAGRPFFTLFSTGRQNFLSYDDNNNVLTAVRIESGTYQATFTSFGYDTLDRPVSSTDAFGKQVGYGYDAVGRVTSLTYPGDRVLHQEFDIRSRLVRQKTASNWGSHVLEYTWDKEGRLTGQTYPNGMIRTAAYDESGRQTAMGYADGKGTSETGDDTVQIALAHAYDRNGNIISSTEQGQPAYTPPAAHDEASAYTAAGRIQARTDAADPTGSRDWTYEFNNGSNSSSINLSKARNPVIGSLTLAYDEDNRTRQLILTPPSGTQSTVVNRYDVLGRRISRVITTGAVPASETCYVLNLTGGMERILADTTSAGAITSYYVHGPDLGVKIDATDPTRITCYHADSSGNVVRTTDKDRTAVAQYAYSDYGRPFSVTGAPVQDDNPYRFVGSHGVMEEPILPGLYFMRARYYLADAGVFLSVDPVKNIGSGWKPEAYGYGNSNPQRFNDPNGEFAYLAGAFAGATAGFMVENARQWGDFLGGGEGFNGSKLLAATTGGAISGVTRFPFVGEAVGELASMAIQDYAGDEEYTGMDYVSNPIASGLLGKLGGKVEGLASIGSKGQLYMGNVKGMKPELLNSAFTGSHGTNTLAKSLLTSGPKDLLKKPTNFIVAAGLAKTANLISGILGAIPNKQSTTTAAASSSGGTKYTIRSGDTLSSIAARSGVSVSSIAAANGISNPNKIMAGNTISIPSKNAGGGSSKPGSVGTSTSKSTGKK